MKTQNTWRLSTSRQSEGLVAEAQLGLREGQGLSPLPREKCSFETDFSASAENALSKALNGSKKNTTMTKTSLESIAEYLADEGQFPARMGHRDPRTPAWTCFDDEKETDPDIRWGRELALDFEEWVAARNHDEALNNRLEEKATIKIVQVGTTPSKELVPAKNVEIIVKQATIAEKLRGSFYKSVCTRRPEPKVDQYREIDADFSVEEEIETKEFLERQDARRYANWLIGWHKRRPMTNDHWHSCLARVMAKIPLDDDKNVKELMVVKRVLSAITNYAPMPVGKTVFRNMDGTTYITNGSDFGKAKTSYLDAQRKRGHEITDELVTVDRVQLVGEKRSKLVVGWRRDSSKTPSSWYDPNPSFQDEGRKEGYQTGAVTLCKVPRSMVMPQGSHRLTVREFEQCLIAGATLLENDLEDTASELEEEYLPDARIRLLNMGYGYNGRDSMSFTHEEAYLMEKLQNLYRSTDNPFWAQAADLMQNEEQWGSVLSAHFHSGATVDENAKELLDSVSYDDEGKEYLQWIKDVISGDGEKDEETRRDAKSRSRSNLQILSQLNAKAEEALKARTRYIRKLRKQADEASIQEAEQLEAEVALLQEEMEKRHKTILGILEAESSVEFSDETDG